MSNTATAPLALVEIHLHGDTLQTRCCRVTYGQNFRFHNGLTEEHAAAGVVSVQGVVCRRSE